MTYGGGERDYAPLSSLRIDRSRHEYGAPMLHQGEATAKEAL